MSATQAYFLMSSSSEGRSEGHEKGRTFDRGMSHRRSIVIRGAGAVSGARAADVLDRAAAPDRRLEPTLARCLGCCDGETGRDP